MGTYSRALYVIDEKRARESAGNSLEKFLGTLASALPFVSPNNGECSYEDRNGGVSDLATVTHTTWRGNVWTNPHHPDKSTHATVTYTKRRYFAHLNCDPTITIDIYFPSDKRIKRIDDLIAAHKGIRI